MYDIFEPGGELVECLSFRVVEERTGGPYVVVGGRHKLFFAPKYALVQGSLVAENACHNKQQHFASLQASHNSSKLQ